MNTKTDGAPNRRVRRFTFSLKLLFAFVAITSISAALTCYWLGYLPGTLRTNVNGFRIEAWGTGVLNNYYVSGAIQSRHWFRAGRHLKSEWYRPDGTVLATTSIQKGEPAKFFSLREDGTVSDEFFLLDGVPEGRWLHYDETGEVDRIDVLRSGLIVSSENVE